MELMTPENSNSLFLATMARYEELSWEIANLNNYACEHYRQQRDFATAYFIASAKKCRMLLIDFVNFARFHDKFYKQIAKNYNEFLRDCHEHRKVSECRAYTLRVNAFWAQVQKAMVDQQLIVLKGA